jgi:hypothetical protein
MKLIAADFSQVFGTITPPSEIKNLTQGKTGAQGLSLFLSNIVTVIYITAAIVFLFMVVISGVQWLTSGGEKEALAKARGRMVYAIVGITLLAIAGVILTALGQILNFPLLGPFRG